HRCDLFSLGAVLYRLLGGRTPFPGDTTMAVLRALAVETPTPLRELAPDVPAPLADLVMRLLSKNAADRLPTAKAVVEALQKIDVPDGSEVVIKQTDKDKKTDKVENPPTGADGKRLFARWEADGFSYPVSVEKRQRGETLVKWTDGVIEKTPNWRLGHVDLKV